MTSSLFIIFDYPLPAHILMASYLLYLITDRTQTLGRPLLEVVAQALEGGVRIVQLREKGLSDRKLFNLAKEMRELTKRYGAKLLINDRLDIAIAAGVDGVHLGQKSILVEDARFVFEKARMPSIIGVSTHSSGEALRAQSDGADFITFGPVYFTPSKAAHGEPVGIDKLRDVSKDVGIPIYAIGGIKKKNIEEAINAGADGVAMISAIMTADNVKITTEWFLKAISPQSVASNRRL